MGIRSQKIVQNSFKKCQFLGSIFESFVGGFGDLWVCPGSLFGSLEVFLGGLLIQKTIKNCGFFNVLKMHVFCSLKILLAVLGSSCYSLSDLVPTRVPKLLGPKWGSKLKKSL